MKGDRRITIAKNIEEIALTKFKQILLKFANIFNCTVNNLNYNKA